MRIQLFRSSFPLLQRGVKCFEILEEKSQFLSSKIFVSLGSQVRGTEKRKILSVLGLVKLPSLRKALVKDGAKLG